MIIHTGAEGRYYTLLVYGKGEEITAEWLKGELERFRRGNDGEPDYR